MPDFRVDKGSIVTRSHPSFELDRLTVQLIGLPTAPPSGRLGAWLEAMLDNGVYLLPDGRWYVSTVHGDAEVDETLDAARPDLAAVAERFP